MLMMLPLPLDKMLCGLPRHQHGAGNIGREYLFKAGEIHLDKRLDHAEAGVIDEDVEMIEFLKQFLIASEDVRLLCHVRVDGMGAYRLAGGGQPLFVAARYRDLRARLGQCLRNRETDAVRSPCD